MRALIYGGSLPSRSYRFSGRGPALASERGFFPRILHADAVIGLAAGPLPMVTQGLHGVHRVESRIVHPMMCLAEIGEIVRVIVRGIVVEMRHVEDGL